jgi:hypothetical protein
LGSFGLPISFDFEPASLDDYFNAIRVVRVASEKPALDGLSDECVACRFGLYEVSVEVDQKPVTPRFSDLAAVQMGNSLDFVAVRAEVSRGAAPSFAYFDGQPVVTKFDHECSEVISESGTG